MLPAKQIWVLEVMTTSFDAQETGQGEWMDLACPVTVTNTLSCFAQMKAKMGL